MNLFEIVDVVLEDDEIDALLAKPAWYKGHRIMTDRKILVIDKRRDEKQGDLIEKINGGDPAGVLKVLDDLMRTHDLSSQLDLRVVVSSPAFATKCNEQFCVDGWITAMAGVCEECGGTGDVYFENEHNHYFVDCKSCGSTGCDRDNPQKTEKHICVYCLGTDTARSRKIDLGITTMSAPYARLLHDARASIAPMIDRADLIYFETPDFFGAIARQS
jgi:hypothetical protein